MPVVNYTRISFDKRASENHIYTDDTIEWVRVYFKLDENSQIYYNVPIKWTIEKFINIINVWIMNDFNLAGRNYKIELVQTGQEIEGVKPENCPKLMSEEITYYDKFIAKNIWPSFYIKINFME
jgi:hypothetical protein